jgi:GR25 family glycosyltransferase involved in LPS biosynthesis
MMNILIISLSSAIERRNFQQIQMEKLTPLGAECTIQVSVSPNTMLDKIIQMPTNPAHNFSGLFLIIMMNILIISLSSAIERRNFQQIQMEKLKLDFEFLEATSIHDIDMITYKKHAKDWQRPLKNTEVACYYSHLKSFEAQAMLSPVLATNFFLFLFSRLINSHFFLSARPAFMI